ncbi:MAG: substrate-binding domain-containing protein [Cyanobacteria bacterium J06639_18]
MRLNALLTVFLGMTAITGVYGCTSENTSQAKVQEQQGIKVTGSGTPYPVLKAVASVYESKNSNIKFNFLPSSQASGGIVGTKNNLVDIGSVSRKPKSDEDDGSLIYQEIAKDALLIATHPSVKEVTNLETKDIKAIYSGKIKNWKDLGGTDAAIILLDRPEDESAKQILRQHYLGKDLNNSPEAVVLRKESELIKTIKNTPYSIGAFSLAEAIGNDLKVNRLSIDGVEPNQENVRLGKYKMVRHLGIVRKKESSDKVNKFIDFIFTEEAAKSIINSGYTPSTNKK